jgi:hypothetical protein
MKSAGLQYSFFSATFLPGSKMLCAEFRWVAGAARVKVFRFGHGDFLFPIWLFC